MGGNDIFSAIRKISLKHLVLPLISVIIAMGIYYLIAFDDAFSPTQIKSGTEAIKLYENGHDYAEINLEKLYYTGFDKISGDEVVASYYYEITGNKCTFYLLDDKAVEDKPLEIENISVKVKLDEKDGLIENMITAFSQNLGWTAEGMLAMTNNVVMNQTEYYVERYIVVYAVLLIVIIYSMALVTMNVLFAVLPWVHPTMIKYYASNNMSIKKAVHELNEEFSNKKVLEAGDMYITEKYFYNLGRNEVTVMPLNKIIMGYEHGKLRSILGKHLKMTHTLYFMGISGRKILASGKNATNVAEITHYLRENYPDIIWGHTKENMMAAKEMVKKHKNKVRKLKLHK